MAKFLGGKAIGAPLAFGLALFASAASAQSLPEAIKKAGEIRVGSQGNFPPVEYFKEGTRELTGFSTELLQEIGRRLGVPVRYVEGEYNGLIPGLAAGRWDMSSGGMTDQPERQKAVDFVNYFASGGAVLLRGGEGKEKSRLKDLCGQTAAVLQGSGPFISAAEKVSDECQAAGKQRITLLKMTTSPDAKQQLDVKRADAYLTDYVSAAYIRDQQPGRYEILGDDYTFTTWFFSWGFPKGSTVLRDAIFKALTEMQADGTYQNILKKWGVPGGALKKIMINSNAS